MATSFIELIPSKYAENAQTTQYSATGVVAIIDKFTVTNVSSSNATITVNIIPGTLSVSNENIILKQYTVPPGKTYTCPELVGHILGAGGFISTIASAASALVIRSSGRTIS